MTGPLSSPSAGRTAWTTVALIILSLARTTPASAQTVTLLGTVTDASTGLPVIGAQVSINDVGPRASTNAEGRFGLVGVPVGAQRIVVRRFGYRTFDATIEITNGMREPAIVLQPDPVQLQELSVNTNTKANITGVVLDAITGLPIPYTGLKLTTDGRKQVGRVADADAKGTFRIQDIALGGYILYVQRMGYVEQYVPIVHALPADPIEIRLQPNAAILDGITVLVQAQDVRRRGFPYETRVFDEAKLRASRANGMRDFFDADAGIRVVDCSSPTSMATGTPRPEARDLPGKNCIDYPRSETVFARVYVDELRLVDPALEGLFVSFGPKDFFKVETYLCPRKGTEPRSARSPGGGAGPPGGYGAPPTPPISLTLNNVRHIEVRAYTYAYMERTAGRVRELIPPCT